MKVLVCCIVKMENNYISEWVEHYKSVGVDNIVICDNNNLNGESLTDVIGDYVKDGFVIIKNYRGKSAYQSIAYAECFKEYKGKYDWIAFFDADEFLDVDDIKGFLSNPVFKNFDCVRVPWRIFDDSGLIETNGDYSVKRFKTFIPRNECKSIVNTKLNYTGGISPHGPLKVNACDPNGEKCRSYDNSLSDSFSKEKHNVWLNHYMLKTLEEYINFKMVRLYPDQSRDRAKGILTLRRFFRFNKLTQEKIDYLISRNIDLSFLTKEEIKDNNLILHK